MVLVAEVEAKAWKGKSKAKIANKLTAKTRLKVDRDIFVL